MDGIFGTLDVLNGATDYSMIQVIFGFVLLFLGGWLIFFTSFYPKNKKEKK
jgi:uncharacterized membrane protein